MAVLDAADLEETTDVNNSIETSSDTTLLLGLEGMAVMRVEVDQDGHRTVHVRTDDESAKACPACGVFATRVKECVLTFPRDLCVGGEPISLAPMRASTATSAAYPCPTSRGGRGTGHAQGLPGLRQVQGSPRRPATGGDRAGGHPRRHPGSLLVLARRHRRRDRDQPGQEGHAGLDPRQDRVGGRPRVHSADNRRTLRSGDHHYILGEKLRSGSPEAKAALSRQGRYTDVAGNLKVKEVRISEHERFVICFNPDGAARDAAVRERLLTQLGELIDGTDDCKSDKRAELRGV
ncbi:hypothetical protein ABGB13_39675, partial [Nonomuraea sp. B10E8]